MLLSTRWISFALNALLVSAASWCEDKPAERPTPQPVVTIRQPALTSVFPKSAQSGRNVEFSIRGRFLDGADRFQYCCYFCLLSPCGTSNLLVVRVTWPEVQKVGGHARHLHGPRSGGDP